MKIAANRKVCWILLTQGKLVRGSDAMRQQYERDHDLTAALGAMEFDLRFLDAARRFLRHPALSRQRARIPSSNSVAASPLLGALGLVYLGRALAARVVAGTALSSEP